MLAGGEERGGGGVGKLWVIFVPVCSGCKLLAKHDDLLGFFWGFLGLGFFWGFFWGFFLVFFFEFFRA